MAENFSSLDENNKGNLAGTFDLALQKMQQRLCIMLPCVVKKVNRNKNSVSVQPLITLLAMNGETPARGIIEDIPIGNLSAGGFIINFPVKVGDYGYIKSNDRDISLFKKSFKMSKPNTIRKNDFADAIFVPDVIDYNKYQIASEDVEALVIQSYDNSTKISLSTNKIILQAETIEQRATNHIFIDGQISHDGINVGKSHVHLQNDGNDAGGGVDTNPPDPL